ncbi:glycoside hydrolase family 3 N-terminal domain-containing protein [Microlunatus soli]|uniref:beta-N-acetylhexosaminidase n=1 Tax=Microlunatus soli TaxID=630515 RepID=A0A1H1S8J9_9ACTN|nr:glycoside hydrolase family 3 N-terminal domain-containing protein [Microlunatus soli]SDS44305.1 beta-N-acetylhexosaminidase [Microlunatus soli]
MRNRRLAPALSVIAVVSLGLVAGCTGTDGPGAAPQAPGSSAAAPSGGASGTAGSSSEPASPDGSAPSESSSSAAEPPAGGKQTCTKLAGELSLNEQVGQLFMIGTDSSGMPDAQAQQLADLKVGSVLLLGNSTAGQNAIRNATDTIRDRVGDSHGVKLILAADQEGGQVQRLAGPGFDTIPSAVEQAEMSPDELTTEAHTWGKQLADAGIDVDLAPVADVVPSSMEGANEPIGQLDRGYGPNPKKVQQHDLAFIAGMQKAKIGTSVKHFPNLGRVRGNTDFQTDVQDTETTRDDKAIKPYRAAIKAGVDMVMVSSATYTQIDPDHPAPFSSTIVTDMVRGDLGFDRVIISDDLQGKALGSVPSSQRALKFVEAGGDLAIVGDPGQAEPMIRKLRSAAADDQELRDKVKQSTARVLAMKATYGLADCRS